MALAPDKWQFLDPWFNILYLDGWPYPKRDAEEEWSIAPHATIRIELSSHAIGQVSRALELATLAIRVDERVWDKLQLEADCHVFNFDSSHYRPEDLELHVEARVSPHSSLDLHFGPTAEACDADRDGPTSVAAYLEARRHISELDVGRRLHGFQVSLTILLEPDDGAIQCGAMLERLVCSGRVAISGAAQAPNGRGQAAVFVVEAVKITPTRLFDDSLLYLGRHEPGYDLSVLDHGLQRLQALGVPITTAVGRVDDNPQFLQWLAYDRALTLELLVGSNAELRRVYETGCRLHEQLTSLTLGIYIDNLDVSLVAMILCELPCVCPSLRSVKLLETFDSAVWDALGEALGAKTDALPVPLPAWLPCLEPFTLRRVRQYRAAIHDVCIDPLLQAFPRLEALDLRDVHLTTWRDLLDAYDTRGCRIRTLALGRQQVAEITASLASHCLKHSPVQPNGSAARYAS